MTPAPAEPVELHFAWSSPWGRVTATYRAAVLRDEAAGDRYVCRLTELAGVERSAPEAIDEDILRGLIGKCVRVPRQALNGITLPLKMSTLTGGLTRPYFFDEA
jgi:hypothetical protein